MCTMLVCKVEAEEKKTHFHIQSKTPSKKSVKTLFFTINFFKKVHLQIDLFFEKTYMKKKFPKSYILFLGDLTELQIVALRWRALAQQVKDGKNPVHFKVLYEALKDLDKEWDRDLLSNEEVS